MFGVSLWYFGGLALQCSRFLALIKVRMSIPHQQIMDPSVMVSSATA